MTRLANPLASEAKVYRVRLVYGNVRTEEASGYLAPDECGQNGSVIPQMAWTTSLEGGLRAMGGCLVSVVMGCGCFGLLEGLRAFLARRVDVLLGFIFPIGRRLRT